MKRRLFNVLAGLSLLLCVALIALWVRSYWIEDYWNYKNRLDGKQIWNGTIVGVTSVRGELECYYQKVPDNPGSNSFRYKHGQVSNPPHGLQDEFRLSVGGCERLGFGWVLRSDPHLVARQFLLPDWCGALMSAMLPLLWTVSLRHRRVRRREECCPTCGYDLRATPDRCPECGTIPKMLVKS